jgi:hypothetical protein
MPEERRSQNADIVVEVRVIQNVEGIDTDLGINRMVPNP